MTFTLLGRCEKTGQIGMGVSTYSPSVGRGLAVGVAGRGMVVVQAVGSGELLARSAKLLEIGGDAAWTLNALATSDASVERRQLAVVDSAGRVAARTGADNPHWAGHVTGDGFVACGNVLVGPQVIEAMAKAFVDSAGAALAERLVRAIEAGRDAGGQPEGQTSAALRVYDKGPYPNVDLRIDAAIEPVGELRRLYDWYSPLEDYYVAQQRQPTGKRWWQHMNDVGRGNWASWLKAKNEGAARAAG